MDKKISFTAASSIPLKLFRNRTFLDAAEGGTVLPVHVQFVPTNRCNLKCSFCSCANRDTRQEMDIEEIDRMVARLEELGTEAVTITGGGEPILHRDFNDMVLLFEDRNIKMGLVTNGVSLHKVPSWILRKLTWCRISFADERTPLPNLGEIVDAAPEVDWAFSYVLSTEPNFVNLRDITRFAEEHNFTHIRVVSDLLHPDAVPIEEVQRHFDSDLVIWQGRNDSTHGRKNCLISLLKPVIGPDGSVYPCCGVQYAREEYDLDLPPEMSMGHWTEMGTSLMKVYDGSNCVRCWYDGYNEALDMLVSPIEHKEFL